MRKLRIRRRDDDFYRRGRPSQRILDLDTLSRCEDHQDFELLLDLAEAVIESSFDEDHAAALNPQVPIRQFQLRFAANYIVKLVFVVRLLLINALCRQYIDSGTHGRDAKKFVVRTRKLRALFHNFREIEGLAQPSAPWKKI